MTEIGAFQSHGNMTFSHLLHLYKQIYDNKDKIISAA